MCGRHRERGGCRCGPEARRGYRFLEPYLLLKLKEKPSYGYELMEGLRERIFHGEPDPGAVYRTLRFLEEEGFVVSRWETESSGPARRYYELTREGEELLDSWAKVIEERFKSLEDFLKEYRESKKGGEK